MTLNAHFYIDGDKVRIFFFVMPCESKMQHYKKKSIKLIPFGIPYITTQDTHVNEISHKNTNKL